MSNYFERILKAFKGYYENLKKLQVVIICKYFYTKTV